jgi:hypothetical protein
MRARPPPNPCMVANLTFIEQFNKEGRRPMASP